MPMLMEMQMMRKLMLIRHHASIREKAEPPMTGKPGEDAYSRAHVSAIRIF
jgi:hypothetical protein